METQIISTKEKQEAIKENRKSYPEEKVFTALCTNCGERWECTIRNNTSVIWHCEEYK